MKVLINFECSEVIKEQFLLLGHDAHSCDLSPGEKGLPNHHQCDAKEVLNDGYDLMIAHPVCTKIANSGVHWLRRRPERWAEMEKDALFFKEILEAKIPMKAIENPIPHHYAVDIIGRTYDQIIQPHQFGEDASKATCLWLIGLERLRPTNNVEPHYACRCGNPVRFEYELGKYGCPNCNGEYVARPVWANQTPSGQNKLGPSEHRQADRARTYLGIAKAMAQQWGSGAPVYQTARML